MGAILTVKTSATSTVDEDDRPHSLIWIDARGAVLVRLVAGRPRIDRIASDVPPRHRSTGHVRHDPTVRHGGGARPQSAGEPHRLEHLGRLVEAVAERVPPGDEVLILGPGTVPRRLARRIRALDRRQGRTRSVACEPSAPRSDRQLIARLRLVAGTPPRRRVVGGGGHVDAGPAGRTR